MQTTFIDIPKARIHVQEEGQGAPLLFVHGNPDSGDLWRPVVDHLKDQYRCIMPDLPGFGRSHAETDFDLSLENRGRYIGHVLDALKVTDPVTVVVHDHGGPFGLSWAVQNPERVRAIVITNTLFHRDYRWHFWGKVWRTPVLGELHGLMGRIPGMALVFSYMEMRYHGGSRGLTWAHIREVNRMFPPSVFPAMLRLYRASDPALFAGWDDKLLALIKQKPSAVLWGERDPYIPVTFAKRLGEAGASLRTFPQYGHWLPVEAHADIAATIRQLLNS